MTDDDRYPDPEAVVEHLREENDELRVIILDTFWMARRYARGRQTLSPSTVNDCLARLAALGFVVRSDHTLVADGNSNPDTLDDI